MSNISNETLSGCQRISSDTLSHDMLFYSGFDRTKYIWVLGHLKENVGLCQEEVHGISSCPKVLFSLAASFLYFYFRAILAQANIFHPIRWYHRLKDDQV